MTDQDKHPLEEAAENLDQCNIQGIQALAHVGDGLRSAASELRDIGTRLVALEQRMPAEGCTEDTLHIGPFTCVRRCVDCGVLLDGGPTRCRSCVRHLEQTQDLAKGRESERVDVTPAGNSAPDPAPSVPELERWRAVWVCQDVTGESPLTINEQLMRALEKKAHTHYSRQLAPLLDRLREAELERDELHQRIEEIARPVLGDEVVDSKTPRDELLTGIGGTLARVVRSARRYGFNRSKESVGDWLDREPWYWSLRPRRRAGRAQEARRRTGGVPTDLPVHTEQQPSVSVARSRARRASGAGQRAGIRAPVASGGVAHGQIRTGGLRGGAAQRQTAIRASKPLRERWRVMSELPEQCERCGDYTFNRAALAELIRKRVIAFLRAQPDDELASLLQEAFGGECYSHDVTTDWETHGSATDARDTVRLLLGHYRIEATNREWSDHVRAIQYGVLVPLGVATEVPDPENEGCADYVLRRKRGE